MSEEEIQEGSRPDRFKAEKTIGEILLAARERADLSLEFASQETKIPVRMLEYLETDNFDAVPAKVYTKGFLKTYAGFLGLDVEHVLNKYEVQTGQTHKTRGDMWEIETEVIEEKLDSPKVFMRVGIPAIIVIVALIIIIRISSCGREPDLVIPPDLPVVTLESEDSTAPQKPEDSTAPQKPEDSTAPQEPVEREEEMDVPIEPQPVELRLTALPADSCWFEIALVSTVDEIPETTRTMFLLQAGRTRTFRATSAIIFEKVGNPAGFTMELNGKRLESLGVRGRVRSNITITIDDLPRD